MAAFAAPVGTDDGRQRGPVGLGVVQAADEVTGDAWASLGGQRIVGLARARGLSLGVLSLALLGFEVLALEVSVSVRALIRR